MKLIADITAFAVLKKKMASQDEGEARCKWKTVGWNSKYTQKNLKVYAALWKKSPYKNPTISAQSV